MKIKFTDDITVLATKWEPEIRFKKGSIHDLREDKAWRWIKRAKAVHLVVEVVAPKMKVGRPMMGEATENAATPKKVGRPKKGA